MAELLVVGSVAYDSISTPKGKAEHTLGGSANYFSVAASLFAPVNVVGVVGDDYKEEDFNILKTRNVNLDGLQQVPGKTFCWEGKYEGDMNEAITLDTRLNVFEAFDPELPESYKDCEYVFLANIDPNLQMKVFNQIKNPKLVGLDTMNFWIDTKVDALKEVLAKVDVLLINEGEAKQLAQNENCVQALKILSKMGPQAIVIKRGEYGFMLYAEEQFFILPAYPVENVVDPTGAGDTFAGGFFGYLTKIDHTELTLNDLKQACVNGCLMASYTVEDFGLGQLKKVDWAKVEARHNEYLKVIAYQY